MTLTISNAMAGIAVSGIAVQANAGRVEVHATAAQPANVEASAFGPVVVCAALGDPAFSLFADTAPGAKVSANGVPITSSAKTSGNLQGVYFRVFSSAGTGLIDGQVTSAAGGGEMTVDVTDVEQDVGVNISTLTITMPES